MDTLLCCSDNRPFREVAFLHNMSGGVTHERTHTNTRTHVHYSSEICCNCCLRAGYVGDKMGAADCDANVLRQKKKPRAPSLIHQQCVSLHFITPAAAHQTSVLLQFFSSLFPSLFFILHFPHPLFPVPCLPLFFPPFTPPVCPYTLPVNPLN